MAVLVAGILLAFPSAGHAQNGTITGVCSLPDVSDWSGITLTVEGTNRSAITGPTGNFIFSNVPAGTLHLRAGKLYYSDTLVSIVLSAGGSVNLTLALSTFFVDTLEGLRTGLFSSASTNVGNIGMPNVYLAASDSGFRWDGLQQLKEGSLMTAISGTQVSDAARTIFGLNQDNLDHDFQAESGIVTLTDGPDSTVHFTAFDDSRANEPPGAPSRPMGIAIKQKTMVYNQNGLSGAMLIELNILNTTRFALPNFVAGWFLDWEAGGTGFTNRGAVITAQQQINDVNDGNPFMTEIAYQQKGTGVGPFVGVVPLSQAMFKAARIASVQKEIIPSAPNGGLSEANKYAYMTARRQDATANTDYGIAEDLATVVSVGGLGGDDIGSSTYTLNAGDEITVGFALVAGSTSADLISNALNAQKKWIALGHSMVIYPSTWPLAGGWRLISLPLDAADKSPATLFPSSISKAYGYHAGYITADTLIPGNGYWLKFPADTVVTISGSLDRIDTVDVSTGWNLIGAPSFDVPTSSLETIPANIISSSVYGYDSGYYQTAILRPIQGYWIKCRQAGKIILHAAQ